MEISGQGNWACGEARRKEQMQKACGRGLGIRGAKAFPSRFLQEVRVGNGGSDGREVEPRVLEVATSKSQIHGVPRWKVTEQEGRLELLELKRRECRTCQTWDVGAGRQRGGNSSWIVSWRSMDTQGELIFQGMEEASKWLAVSSSSVPKMLGGEDWEQKR